MAFCQEDNTTGILLYYWLEYKQAQAFWETIQYYLTQLKMYTPIIPKSLFYICSLEKILWINFLCGKVYK